MFVLIFSLYLRIATVYENIYIIGGIFLLHITCLFIRKILKKKSIKKQILFLCLAIVLVVVSTWKKLISYGESLPWTTSFIPYIGTWTIVDVSSKWKYIVQDNATNEYILQSKKSYEMWDLLFLVWSTQPWYTWSKEIINMEKQRWRLEIKDIVAPYQFNYTKWLMMKNYVWTVKETNSILIAKESWLWFFKKMKKKIQALTLEAYGENRISWLILGMTIGDKSLIPKEEYQTTIDSWLVHLIAVSWGNIMMIAIFLSFVLRFIPFYIRTGIIILSIFFYAWICWLDSSVFRATIMSAFSLAALFWWREVIIWRSLSVAYIIMLCINPYFLVYDVWFLLSFWAIIGLIYFQKLFVIKESKNKQQWLVAKVKQRLPSFVNTYISPSIAATLGIIPIIIFFMGKINLLWLLANIPVIPLVPFIMIYGFISILLYPLVHWEWILRIEKMWVEYIYMISKVTAKFGIYLLADSEWIKYILLGITILFFVYARVFKKTTDWQDKDKKEQRPSHKIGEDLSNMFKKEE